MMNNDYSPTSQSSNKFERGFKNWCENSAESFRTRLRKPKYAPLMPQDLFDQLKVTTWSIDKVPDLDNKVLNYLTSPEGNDEWSAVTVSKNDYHIIVYNHLHTPSRQNSDIMHELAHVIRNHKPAQIFYIDGLALRSYDELQELEANWLGFCLLLPKSAILSAYYNQYSFDQLCKYYGVSKELARFRINVTGLAKVVSFK